MLNLLWLKKLPTLIPLTGLRLITIESELQQALDIDELMGYTFCGTFLR